MCEAYKNSLLYPRYLFFTISWYNAGWWRDGVEQYGCTPEQMEQVLEHTLTIVFLPSARYLDPSLTTDTKANLTIGEYLRRESEDYVNSAPLNISKVDEFSSDCYDGMYAFTYALNNTINGMRIYSFLVCYLCF
ncbi:hypothetical protein GBAR_LOCUS6519 [Geodia barretti]|uniref:Uncharacterized protein n=1 Tax=Geodia barretti TaxID=519541 RepID=A0AA35RGM2_GEOBA|nr:hypothetical protein GBAR_LOCUS6519 [Geodia barretti]